MGYLHRELLGIRRYVLDGRHHAYRAGCLSPGPWLQIHPVCQDLDAVPGDQLFQQLYELAHPTHLIDPHPYATLGGRGVACARCARQLRALNYDIVIDGELVATGGPLDLHHHNHPQTRQLALPTGPVLAGA